MPHAFILRLAAQDDARAGILWIPHSPALPPHKEMKPIPTALPSGGTAPRLLPLGAALLFLLAPSAPRALSQGSTPPPVAITRGSVQVAGGLIFLTPSPPRSLAPGEGASTGPEIVDGAGRPVWFQPLPAGDIAADLRVQTYQGEPVLTWAQGPGFQQVQAGANTNYICDTSYRVVATVQAGDGLNADEHEFQLTPEGTALITIYNILPADLSSVGGQPGGLLEEGVVQEIEVSTGAVLLEWHSSDHVPPAESYAPVPAFGPFDYFHINSVTVDTDGNLLISSRHTWTVYKVDRATGEVIWRLGGKKSDFALGPGLPFAWQHNAVAVDAGTIRIFDNESNGKAVLPASRVIWVKHDDSAMTASISRSVQHPDGLSAAAEGDGQELANGDTFVGWGILGRFSEFDPAGSLIFDGSLPAGYNDYRAYRLPWVATPAAPPSAAAQFNDDGTSTVHAVWNGATEVATWQVLGGASQGSLAPLGTMAWNGLDTSQVFPGQPDYVQVVALDSSGARLGASAASAIAPGFTLQPVSQAIPSGSSVVFRAAATGPAPAYQWYLNGNPVSDGASSGVTYLGSASATLLITGSAPSAAGSYTCVATAGTSPATSSPATLTLSDTQDIGRLTNVSARAVVGTGDNVLIAGFVVGGQQASGTEDLLVRASGPALASFGVASVLPDPQLVLTKIGAAAMATKMLSGWSGNALVASTASAVGAFAWTDPSSQDAATVHGFHTGSHTAEVVGTSGDTGVALVEVYDATPQGTFRPSLPHLLNVSARANVGIGDNVLIAGFVIGGSTSKTVLIRASGPALAAYGVSGVLPDPELELFDAASGGVLATNDGWGGDPGVASAADLAGAFPWLDPASGDSAILVTLPPGSYTAEVYGQAGDTGLALVEVFEVP